VYWKIEAVSHGKVTLDNLEVYWKPRDRALVAFTVYTNDVEGGMACADTDAQKASRYANHLNELKRRLNTEVKRREAERTK
jgi:hypothetical protein